MSKPAQKLAAELDRESAATRRILERVPADHLDWQPHPKSMSLGQLAFHIAGIPGNVCRMAKLDGFEVPAEGPRPASSGAAADLLPLLEASLHDAKSFLGSLDDAAAETPWTLRAGGREVFTLPRLDVVRTMMLNHLYHHRGQLAVYLRLLDVPVPVIYGRSADENPFAGATAV